MQPPPPNPKKQIYESMLQSDKQKEELYYAGAEQGYITYS
jgi:hypothetical protein